MKTGTCHFPSYGAALRHYRAYVHVSEGRHAAREKRRNQTLCALVDAKLNSGEIHIGRPVLRQGQRLVIEDNRYHVVEGSK